MVGNVDLRNLETLAGQYGIHQKLESDLWPSALELIVRRTKLLTKIDFQTYRSINNDPWKKENKARAEWLVEQASRLSQNTTNENSWRMRIENVVLERFSFEVACPVCKDRLWRSEIESSYTGSSRVWKELDQRRMNRAPCNCPDGERPQHRYDIGTSRLFEDRVDEQVIYEDEDVELPTQRPDRIVGLRETNKMRILLDQPPRLLSESDARNIRDLITHSPFKRQQNPLLFPFLALEAKSDSAPMSFHAMQMQTAFPIRRLLNLQRDLQLRSASREDEPQPLVWFLGYKGNDWKLYGCYISMNAQAQPTYNIHYLQGGDLTTKDGALHLLLLVDFIVDWARDTFRTAIVAQLSSLATGKSFDEVSLGPDSDIFSKERTIQDWISRAHSTTARDEPLGPPEDESLFPEVYNGMDAVELPCTKLGAVRHMSAVDFQLTGLRLTEGNVESLLALSDGPPDGKPGSQSHAYSKSARKLVNELTRWDEILVVLGADLDYVEHIWSDEKETFQEPFDEGPGAEFYAVFEYRCFVDISWKVTRELSYFAVSKAAYVILLEHAAFRIRHPYLDSLPKVLRPCPSGAFVEAIECLRSGSTWQVLHSAFSSTLLTIFPAPPKVRDDHIPRVAFLEFGYTHALRVRYFLDEFMELAERPMARLHSRKRHKRDTHAWEERQRNRSFRRSIRRSIRVSEDCHNKHTCTRCRRGNQDPFALRYWDPENIPLRTVYGALLVASLEEEPERSDRSQMVYDLSLFVFKRSPWLECRTSVSTVVGDLAQNDSIYHTIRHGLDMKAADPKAVLWNLPHPYRKSTDRQKSDIACWIQELNPEWILDADLHPEPMVPWVHQQILLCFLRQGMPYDGALVALTHFQNGKKKQYIGHQGGDCPFQEVSVDCTSLCDFYAKFCPRDLESRFPCRLQLRGQESSDAPNN